VIPRYLKPGEALAMASTHLHQDRKGFFWMLGSAPLPNERKGDVVIVHVRGELEHHKEAFSCAESYEGILEKFRAAYAGESENEDGEITCEPPKAIVLCLDSPGGVVSGLNECVRELQRLRKEHPEIEVSCYVNEMACSAAYALACSCDEIICPPSAILGSIGVISTMISTAGADKKAGYDVRLLTSGERKADGHLHAPISDGAIAAETQRVEKLALAFFRLAGKARNLSVEKIRSFQAGIFLGKDAIRAGLADELMSYDDLVTGAQDKESTSAASGGNQTDRRLNEGKTMTINAILRKLAAEDDPAKREALTVKLAASISSTLAGYKKTEKHVEHVKTEEEDDEETEEAEEKSAEEDEKSAKSADEEEKKASAKADDEDDDDGDEDDAKSAKKALALVKSITGMTSAKKAFGALQAIAMTAANTAADVAKLKKDQARSEKANLIASAKGKYLTTKEAEWLTAQPMSTVKGFVEMRQKAGVIVHTDESTLHVPKAGRPGTVESLPQYTRDMIDAAVASASGDKKKIREELEAAHLKAHNEQLSRALNGAADGRY
jgi:ClpP class serine protease